MHGEKFRRAQNPLLEERCPELKDRLLFGIPTPPTCSSSHTRVVPGAWPLSYGLDSRKLSTIYPPGTLQAHENVRGSALESGEH